MLVPDPVGIAVAAELIRAGRLVAFPTETVYGLGANALDANAVAAIFRAKARPLQDPVIVHLASADELDRVAAPAESARELAARFWPGPLTLELPKTKAVPPNVTAGLPSVAVRVPAHTVAQALIRAAGTPIAAPSANLFGRTSPTRAAHVLADLRGRIDAVLDGGPTTVGVESTIVDLSSDRPRLLRPGGVPAEAVEAVLGEPLEPPPAPSPSDVPQVAPGLLATHYAPRTPLSLVAGEPGAARTRLVEEIERAKTRGLRVGVRAVDDDRELLPAGIVVRCVGSWSDPSASAAHIFEALRALDEERLDLLVARELAEPTIGLGRALADRLRRAATTVVTV